MKITAAKTSDVLMALFRIVTATFMLFFMGVLIFTAMLGTTGMEIIKEGQGVDTIVQQIREQIESVVFYYDNIFANVIWFVLLTVAAYLLLPLLKKIPLWAEIAFVVLWTVVLGIIWVRSSQVAPSEDSWRVSSTAFDFSKNDLHMLTGDDRYFKNYSFQLGFVLFEELLIRAAGLFGEVTNFIFIQEISVLLIASSYAALLMTIDIIFEDKRVRHMAALLLIFCIQPIISCTFLYGIIPGFAFAAWAVHFEIRFIKTQSWKKKILWGILSAFCLTVSVVIKSNNLIVMVAMVILAAVSSLRSKKSLFNILLSAVCVISCITAPKGIISMYEKRANVDLGDSIPMISWFAMGMQETSNAPGWYNIKYTVFNFDNAGLDSDKAAEQSVAEIKNRLKYFSENKQYRNDFFYKKYVSVWNETTYQSLWNNKVRLQYKDKSFPAAWICNDAERGTRRYMDIFSQFVFILCFCGILYCLKRKNTFAMIMPMIILGGMLYHLLAEAKSQYALPYFIWMTAFASCGFVFISDKIKVIVKNYISTIKNKKAANTQ